MYVTLMLPFTTRMQLSGMVALGDVVPGGVAGQRRGAAADQPPRSCCRCCGPTIAGAAALMFVLLTHEFTASLLVRAPTTQVDGHDPVRLLGQRLVPAGRGDRPVMTLVTAAGVFVAMSVAGSDIFDKL